MHRPIVLAGLGLLVSCAPKEAATQPGDAVLFEPVAPPGMLVASTAQLNATRVAAHTGVAIAPATNVIYCATFQLAWDAAIRDVVGEAIALAGDAETTNLVEVLNSGAFPDDALDAGSYVARAGFGGDGIVEAITADLAAKFGERAPNVGVELNPTDFLAYAYLRKSLPLARPFPSLAEPLTFAGGSREVAAFGYGEGTRDPDAAAVLAQATLMSLLDSPAGPEFVIEVALGDPRDRLVLARLAPRATLEETWAEVTTRLAASEPRPVLPGREVVIPKINFDLMHAYAELEDRSFTNSHLVNYLVRSAAQQVRFQLTEQGADLESTAYIGAGLISSGPTPLVFDRPFLVSLIESGASRPYFLAWIGNDELLMSFEN